MQKRIIQAGLAGMNQDVINPKVNTLYAYEIKNFRINSTGHSNGIELTTEKETKLIKIKFEQTSDIWSGLYNIRCDSIDNFLNRYRIPDHGDSSLIWPFLAYNTYETVGYCVLNEYIVVFVHATHSEHADRKRDCIIRLRYDDSDLNNLYGKPLFYGDLGFDSDHRIECIPYMESVDIQKVYWIDGKNYPRVINIKRQYEFQTDTLGTIVDEDGYLDYQDGEDPFSFYQKISSGGYNTIDIRKTYVGGLFYAGVIQYAFSFYNKNAQETPIIYTTPLNYISHSDRGEQPNKQLGCAFEVTININPDDYDNFEYVRVYSIYRSSINGTPVVKVIKDTKCENFTDNSGYYSTTFVDTNEQGYDFDAYRILVNSDHIKPEAIGYKDQKLFLGNYDTDGTLTSDDRFMNDFQIEWLNNDTNKQVLHYDSSELKFYEYLNQLSQDVSGKTKDSSIVKTFKYGEYYKLGLLFQDEFGNWSGVYPVKTLINDKHPVYNSDNVKLPYALMTQDIGDIYNAVQDRQYKKVRPVITFPTISERRILCQGIINPTVFNITDRCQGTCFALSSWFFRPYPFESSLRQFDLDTGNTHYIVDNVKNDGAVCQFKHYEPLFPNDDIGCEIQGMYFDVDIDRSTPAERPKKNAIELDVSLDDLTRYKNYFYVDHSVCTINSPDLDFDENLKNVDYGQYNVRIVGIVPFTNNYGNYNIIAENPLFLRNKEVDGEYIQGTDMASGFQHYQWKQRGGWHSTNVWCAGSQQVSALNCWFDDLNGFFNFAWADEDSYNWNEKSREVSYYVYPWNKDYLNNYRDNIGVTLSTSVKIEEDIESSKTLKKVLSNMKFSTNTYLFDFDSTSGDVGQYDIDTETLKLFNMTDSDNYLKLGNDIFYRGNVDSLLTYDSKFNGFEIIRNPDIMHLDPISLQLNGYPIMVGWPYAPDLYNNGPQSDPTRYNYLSSKKYILERSEPDFLVNHNFFNSINVTSQSPILMRYKSSPHIVFQISETPASQGVRAVQNVLPIKDGSAYSIDPEEYQNKTLVWNDENVDIVQDGIDIDSYITDSSFSSRNYDKCGYLWLGELYKDDNNPYQNNDFDDSKDRSWVPCGPEYELTEDGSQHVSWIEGDTYFQRYDCLKTYPHSSDDTQSVVDLASFMVETHINLDGRYDENRGLLDNTFINPTNFNLLNPVYNQTNNFFQYNVLDEEDFKTTDFPTRFTWSLNKINGLDIDEWTRTNTSAFYDCDGDKGELTSLRRFNGQIYAFQEKGISRIKYNENVAINTNNGTPIELANSLSVNGVEYLSELVGSQNKWSNISTPNGIFFTDNYTAGLYRLNGQSGLTNLTKNVLQRWFESNNTNHDFIDTASYDANMNEIHFMFDNLSLAYNNDFGTFSSFYDYKGWIGNIKNHSFNITDNKMYFLREGLMYNTFYGIIKPYWIEFVANSNIDGYSPSNAIYDNVWYNADVLADAEYGVDNMNYDEIIEYTEDKIPRYPDGDFTRWYETFTKIEAGNDYQYGKFDNDPDEHTQTKNFKFIKKFRTWRVPVPRNQIGTKSGNLHRDRMLNQWLRVKLTNTNPSTNKMVLRDIYVDSFF